jgi:hypothetical protein
LSALKGFTSDNEKLDILLGYFEQGQMSQEQAQELQQLLEPLYRKSLDARNFDRAKQIADILMSLRGILSGRISINIVENVPIGERLDAKKINK